MSKPIVMGRKTYESIGRPLPGRQNVVISRNSEYKLEGCDVVTSIESALELLSNHEEIMIIGGGFLYSKMIDKADKLFLTFIDLDVDGDTYFPEYEQLKLKLVSEIACLKDEKNPYNYRFANYEVSR